MKYNHGKCDCCGDEYPLIELDDNGHCEHCIEHHNIADLDTDDRFKCCICQRIFYGIEDANNHRVPDVNGLAHTVVPITKCIFCHGC